MATPTPNIVGDTTADNFSTPPNDNTTPLTSSYSNTGSVPISRPNGSGTMNVQTDNENQAPTENTTPSAPSARISTPVPPTTTTIQQTPLQ